jgi:hypothetical protein
VQIAEHNTALDVTKPFRRDGLGFRYAPVDAAGHTYGVTLKVDYIHRRSDEMTGEVLVEADLPGIPAHVHQARLNLTSTVSRETLVKHLHLKTKDRVPWRELIELFCAAVLRAEREGEPFLRVGQMPYAADPPDLVNLLVPDQMITLLYAAGGVGKGWIATAASVAVENGLSLAGLPAMQRETLYLDWEDTPARLNQRVQMVTTGLRLEDFKPLHYRACRGSLPRQINQVARYVTEHNIGFLVVDSVELACGASAEHRSYEDKAQEFFEALRYLGPIAVLCIDHISAEASQNTGGANKAFGSFLKMAWVRCAWEARKDQMTGASTTLLGLYNTKTNHRSQVMPLGFALDFTERQQVTITRADVRDSDELVKPMPTAERIAAALWHRTKTVKEIAEESGLKEEVVRTTLNRGKGKRFETDPVGRWGLISNSQSRARDNGSDARLVQLDDGSHVFF